MTASITTLPTADPRERNRQLMVENVDRSAAAMGQGLAADSFFYSGVASGVIYADALTHSRQTSHVVAFIAENRQNATPGADSPESALANCLFIDPEIRAKRARASGVMHGFKLGTEHRPDAVECASCGDRILTDVMPHVTCPAGTHPPRIRSRE